MKLSIIIPVYNVEAYIERCIRSLEEQDIPENEYELLVTNDGSPDNSLEIIKNLQKEYSNIIVIDQENQGVSMARNNAIDIARGRYILPIDPDDYIVPNSLNKILKIAEEEDLDALYLSFAFHDINENIIWQCDFSRLENKIFTGPETFFISHDKNIQDKDPDRSWGILFKRDILTKHNLDYPRDVPFLEDGIFLVKFFVLAQKCSFSDILFYMRTTRIGSATKSKLIYTEKSLKGFFLGVEDLEEFNGKHQLNDFQQEVINQGMAKFILLPLMTCVHDHNYSSFLNFRKALKLKGYRKLNVEGCKQVYKTLAKAYNLSIIGFYPFYFIFSKFKALKVKLGWM